MSVTQVLGENWGEYITMGEIGRDERNHVYEVVCEALLKPWIRAYLTDKPLDPRQYLVSLENGRLVYFPAQFTTDESAESL